MLNVSGPAAFQVAQLGWDSVFENRVVTSDGSDVVLAKILRLPTSKALHLVAVVL